METIQSRLVIIILTPEEIAFINGFVDKKKLAESAKIYGKSSYGKYLMVVARGRVKY